MLNADYKILTKLLALRVRQVLPSIIHNIQLGYVIRRYIGEVMRVIEDIMTYTDIQHIPGILIFVDFEKASDSIE